VRLQDAGILTIKAILGSYLVSHLVLKTAFARNRPNRPLKGGELEEHFTRDPFDFFNWHEPYLVSNDDGTAFPSWHFALYFSVAKVMQLHFDNYWIPYTVSMFPLVYEADGHRHGSRIWWPGGHRHLCREGGVRELPWGGKGALRARGAGMVLRHHPLLRALGSLRERVVLSRSTAEEGTRSFIRCSDSVLEDPEMRLGSSRLRPAFS